MCNSKMFRNGLLADLRKRRGYSQRALAELAGVSQHSISKWESGEVTPNTKNVRALCAVFGIKEDDLYCTRPKNTIYEIPEEEPEIKSETVCPELEERVEKLEELMNKYISNLESLNTALLQVQDQEREYYERLTAINKEVYLLKCTKESLVKSMFRKALFS